MLDLIKKIEQKRDQSGRTQPLRNQFQLQLKSIQDAVNRGYSRKEIWQILSEEKLFSGSYIMFAQYCREYLNKKSQPTPPPTKTKREPLRTPTEPKSKTSFNPTTFGKEYLLERATPEQ